MVENGRARYYLVHDVCHVCVRCTLLPYNCGWLLLRFFIVFKKTKRKSHWQPTNHNKKKRWTETLSLRLKNNWKHIYMHICRCTSVYIVLRLGVEPVIIVIPSQISLWTVLLSILCCFLHIIFSIPLEHLFKSTNEPIKRLMRGRATEMRERATESKKKDIKCDF